jgi:hypothetical protein
MVDQHLKEHAKSKSLRRARCNGSDEQGKELASLEASNQVKATIINN